LHSTDYADLIESANLDESLQKLDEVIASSGNNPVALHELTQIQRKLRTQKAVHSARLEYIARMSAIWKEMVEKVTEAQNNRNNHTLILLAFEAAHKFKGTSGSYGLTHISEIAGQMESFLKSIDPSCTKEETGIYWSEISHLLAEGTDIVQALTHIDPAKKEDQEERLISLLLVSPNDEYRTLISKTVAHNIDLHVVNSAAGAATRATSIAIDAAVIDLSLDIPGLVSTLTRSLRSIRHRSQLPFIFIANPFQYSNISELVYSGCSALLEPPVTAKALEDAVQCLRSTFKSREKRILCVDDDEMLTFFLSCVLNPEGYEVKSLHEPIHILETLESFQPDLILLDVMMPGLGGYEVCRMLRSHKEWSHIPIVFLTVKSDAESRSAAFQAGGNDFLAKPVVAQELITRVEAHLAIAEKEAKTEIGEVPDVLTWEAFRKQASRALQQCDRDHTPVSLGMIVIEGYAQLDDRHGGYSKQQVLAQLGYLLSIRFRITDIRGMWEDGAFAIMFPGESAATTAGALQLLQEEMAQTVFMCNSGDQFHITAAVGVSDVGADGLTLESLAKSALNRATNPEPVFKIPTSAAALRSLPTT
jgi:diguanylate cyclase (GGDEF)-like protein